MLTLSLHVERKAETEVERGRDRLRDAVSGLQTLVPWRVEREEGRF